MASERQVVGAVTGVSWRDDYDVRVRWAAEALDRGESWYMHDCMPESVAVVGPTRITQEEVCTVFRDNISLAVINSDTAITPASDWFAARGLDDENHYQIINFTGVFADSSLLLLSSGDLIMPAYGPGGMRIVGNFKDKLQFVSIRKDKNTNTGYYSLDSGDAEAIVDETGEAVRARSMAISANERYLAVEVYGKGIAVVDLNNLSIKYIALDVVGYSGGEYMRLAISSDSKRVAAVSGDYRLAKVYSLDDDCRYGDYMDLREGGGLECYSVDMSYSLTERSSHLANTSPFQLSFSADNSMLTIDSYRKSGDKSTVSTTIRPDPNARHLDYLAMGDSFSSGEGDTEINKSKQKYYRSGTDTKGASGVPEEKCHVSTRSYPYLLARGMHLAIDSPRQWNTATCSGAKTEDISPVESWWMRQGVNYAGQGDRLLGFDVGNMKKIGLNEFIPGREQQVEFVKKYQPKFITLTMGGNDVGFGEKIDKCVRPLACEYVRAEGRLSLANQIEGQYDKFVALYKDLYKASRYKAKIYVLGYPQFINGSADASCKANVGALNDQERLMIVESTSYLNKVIKQAARAAGVMYVDIEGSLYGHKLCDSSANKYVTGISGVLGADGNQIQESFHPNHNGHMQMAFTVWDRVKGESLLYYDVCDDGRNNCPDPSATKESIARPSYFPQEKKNSIYKNMTTSTVSKGSFMNVVVPTMLLKPHSLARATLHSDPIDLGIYTASDEGSLSFSAEVPNYVLAGYHTLIINGEDANGEPVEVEQIVLVLGSDPGDVDENGTPDNQQVCGAFIEPSGLDEDGDGIDDSCDPMIEIEVDKVMEEAKNTYDNDTATNNEGVKVVHRRYSEGDSSYSLQRIMTDLEKGVVFDQTNDSSSAGSMDSEESEELTGQRSGTLSYSWIVWAILPICAALLIARIMLTVQVGEEIN